MNLALGLGYEYNINIGGFGVLRPYAGFDFVYQTALASEAIHDDYDWEVGGGLQWLFRGTGAQFKRDKKSRYSCCMPGENILYYRRHLFLLQHRSQCSEHTRQRYKA